MQQNHQIHQKGVTDLAFQPKKDAIKHLNLPTAYPSWPLIKQILTNLADAPLDVDSIIEKISQIISIINQFSQDDCDLPQLRKFFTAIQMNEKSEPNDKQEQEQKKTTQRIFDSDLTTKYIQTELIPYIAKQALLIEEYWPDKKIQTLQAGENKSLKFKKHQVACLMANIFLCTIKDSDTHKDYPMERTFLTIFSMKSKTKKPTGHLIHKIMCLFNYFNRMKQGKHCKDDIQVERICLSKEEYYSADQWTKLQMPMKDVKYFEQGKIQEVATQYSVEIDFANQFIGGGALFYGCVQQEIMFVISPQLLITCSLCRRMRANESIIISGVERFSDYKGYSYGFQFAKNFQQKLKVVKKISAIDALYLRSQAQIPLQFKPNLILRQLNKANAGFMTSRHQSEIDLKRDIVTGKWGCGAFNGDAELKFIIQWLASSAQGRNMVFCGFHDKSLAKVPEIVEHVLGCKVSVGDFFRKLVEVCNAQGFNQEVFKELAKVQNWKQ